MAADTLRSRLQLLADLSSGRIELGIVASVSINYR